MSDERISDDRSAIKYEYVLFVLYAFVHSRDGYASRRRGVPRRNEHDISWIFTTVFIAVYNGYIFFCFYSDDDDDADDEREREAEDHSTPSTLF